VKLRKDHLRHALSQFFCGKLREHTILHQNEKRMGKTKSASDMLGGEYWNHFCRNYIGQSKFINPGRIEASRRLFINRLSTSAPWLEAVINVNPKRGNPRVIGVWLVLEGDDPASDYLRLLERKEKFERAVGKVGVERSFECWDWSPDRSTKSAPVHRRTIRLEKVADAEYRPDWVNQHTWLFEALSRFFKVFRPHIPLMASATK
jgi:hypothetical protein